MAVRLYNSLTRTVEELLPRVPGKVGMFVCGPTVYDFIHVGNARTFTVFDMVVGWLRYRGMDVTYIQNITDVDDKIIRRAVESGKEPLVFAREFELAFLDDMKSLGNTAVSTFARATDYIPQVMGQVKTLIAKNHVYLIDGDGWYFDLSTFPDYGKLSGRTGLQADDAVSRIDDNEKKRNTGDFCVWKLSKPGEPVWEDAQLGAGRPGWHIEDTAITQQLLGSQYDIHGGGTDLKFPHHEAEIAQQESASELVPFVKYWMHAGFLQVNAQRMGKSVGNFDTLRSLMEVHDRAVLRFFLLSGHYRAPLDYSDTQLAAAQAAVQRIGELMRKNTGKSADPASTLQSIEDAMDDDFNTAKAFAAIFTFIRRCNADGTVPPPSFFEFIQNIFGVVPDASPEIPADIQTLVEKRQSAREQKDFTASDILRDEITKMGYTVDDTPYGPLVKKR